APEHRSYERSPTSSRADAIQFSARLRLRKAVPLLLRQSSGFGEAVLGAGDDGGEGGQDEEDAGGGGDAFAAFEVEEDREAMAEDGEEADERDPRPAGHHVERGERGERALGGVTDQRPGAEGAAEGARDVGGADVAA